MLRERKPYCWTFALLFLFLRPNVLSSATYKVTRVHCQRLSQMLTVSTELHMLRSACIPEPKNSATFCFEANLALSAALAALAFGAIVWRDFGCGVYLMSMPRWPPQSQASWCHALHLLLPGTWVEFDASCTHKDSALKRDAFLLTTIMAIQKDGSHCHRFRRLP